MSLQGEAFLALWNDVAPGHEREYDAWHTREHVPERVRVPGIFAGRRYAAMADVATAVHRYFTLYELADLAVLESAAYRQLVRDPTAWSQAMRPRLRRFLRAACVARSSRSTGVGGALVTLRFDQSRTPAQMAALVHDCQNLPGIVGVHWGVADAHATAPAWVSRADTEPVAAVLLLECYSPSEARQVQAAVLAQLGPMDGAGGAGCYELRYLHDRRLADAVTGTA